MPCEFNITSFLLVNESNFYTNNIISISALLVNCYKTTSENYHCRTDNQDGWAHPYRLFLSKCDSYIQCTYTYILKHIIQPLYEFFAKVFFISALVGIFSPLRTINLLHSPKNITHNLFHCLNLKYPKKLRKIFTLNIFRQNILYNTYSIKLFNEIILQLNKFYV